MPSRASGKRATTRSQRQNCSWTPTSGNGKPCGRISRTSLRSRRRRLQQRLFRRECGPWSRRRWRSSPLQGVPCGVPEAAEVGWGIFHRLSVYRQCGKISEWSVPPTCVVAETVAFAPHCRGPRRERVPAQGHLCRESVRLPFLVHDADGYSKRCAQSWRYVCLPCTTSLWAKQLKQKNNS